MKKTYFSVLAVFFICAFSACSSLGSLKYSEPPFEKPSFEKSSVYVIDSNKAKARIKDYVKLHNFSTDSDIEFSVYVHHPGTHEWMLYGIGMLKDPGDTDTIDSNMGKIKNYRYFAIEPKDGKTYRYQFYVRQNDLHIDILDI